MVPQHGDQLRRVIVSHAPLAQKHRGLSASGYGLERGIMKEIQELLPVGKDLFRDAGANNVARMGHMRTALREEVTWKLHGSKERHCQFLFQSMEFDQEPGLRL